jgi:hypothetical protein
MFGGLSNKCNKWEAPVKPRMVSSTLTRFSVRQITAAERESVPTGTLSFDVIAGS